MIRRIIHIDQDLCSGCGACASACHEGAIAMINGKAVLMRDDYCDGLGDCLPHCPTGAITFVEREAADYDRQAVEAHMRARSTAAPQPACPGSQVHAFHPKEPIPSSGGSTSQLRQWPVQIKLAPIQADFYDGASLLIAADCTAYAYARFHDHFMAGRITLIGCPKLDHADYAQKLTEILRHNAIKDITLVRMEVPCCGGLERAVLQAIEQSGISLPCHVQIIRINGTLLK